MKLIALIAALVSAAEIAVEEGVLVGTVDNFDEIIADNKFVLVEFYAPWCGHCKSLAPEYAAAATALASNSDVKLVKVDATVEATLAQSFEVGGYPTLKFFKNGDKTGMEYGGGRTEDEIVAWITKKSGPPALSVSGADAANALKEENDVVFVTFGEDTTVFLAAADSYDAAVFAVLDAEAAAALDVQSGSAVLLKNFDNGRIEYDGDNTAEDMVKFVKLEGIPLVSEFNEETAPKIFGGDITQHLLMFAAKSDESFATEMAAFSAAAAQFKGETLFVLVDCDVEDNGRVLEFFGLKQEECTAVRLIQMGESMAKFKPPTDDLTTESFVALVKGVNDGSITKHLMSEDVEEGHSEGNILIITGKNFEGIAYNEDTHVLVEFYAPWCGHCKALEPTWAKLADHFADRDDIVIAKSDATTNEFDGVDVQGFPTLKFFPKGGDREVIDYEGGRDLESLIKFIESDGLEGNESAGEDDEDYDEEDYDDEDYEDDEEDDEDGHDEL